MNLPQDGRSHPYSQHFDAEGAAESYERKFKVRIDVVRHLREEKILAGICRGELLDCSIGIGRFIGKFPKVSRYSGLDYSREFLKYCKDKHPDLDFRFADLLQGIPHEDDRFDTTLCLRTLSSLGKVEHVLAEMKRVTRPGGRIVFDYGTSPGNTTVEGARISTSESDVASLREKLGMREIESVPVDGLALWIKKSYYFSRIDERLLKKLVPNAWIEYGDRITSKLSPDRRIHVWER